MSIVLNVNGVTKEYGDKKVVDSVSFHVNRGEILGVLGPNGAGKTTAIRMIMGITAPDSGEINFTLDENGYGSPISEKIGYLPEERGLYKNERVMDILVFLAAWVR